MAHIKYLLISLLPLLFTACDGHADSECSSSSKGASSKEEVYDYRDERYQDFYSRYMRKGGNRELIFDPEDIQEKLGLQNIPDKAYGKMIINRIPEDQEDSPINAFKNSGDVLRHFNQDGAEYMPCEERYQVANLFCIQKIKSSVEQKEYYYLPRKYAQINYIDEAIFFSCTEWDDEKNCKMMYKKTAPYHLSIWVSFTNPENFFYIMPFIEKHFYETTGEHIWQNLPKQ